MFKLLKDSCKVWFASLSIRCIAAPMLALSALHYLLIQLETKSSFYAQMKPVERLAN